MNDTDLDLCSPPLKGTMLGLLCEEGALLAINLSRYRIYYLKDTIYCCAPNTNMDRRVLTDVYRQLEDLLHAKGAKVSVQQSIDLVHKEYRMLCEEVILAGQDVNGLQLHHLRGCAFPTSESYIAAGTGSEQAIKYLDSKWNANMSLDEAEKLARAAIIAADTDTCDKPKIEICILWKPNQEEET